jgi:hypothetical protein
MNDEWAKGIKCTASMIGSKDGKYVCSATAATYTVYEANDGKCTKAAAAQTAVTNTEVTKKMPKLALYTSATANKGVGTITYGACVKPAVAISTSYKSWKVSDAKAIAGLSAAALAVAATLY